MHKLMSVLIVFGVAGHCCAWNKAGHMVSGAIAYAQLKAANPAVADRVIQLLKTHPQYEKSWAQRLEDAPDGERDLTLFMLAARWADDIRGDAAYHHSRWHYINLPFKPAGQPDSVVPPAADADNILRAFEVNLAIAANEKAVDADRAIALTWIFHLVGDAHQPLHSTALFTTDYPRGDRGGNSVMIRVKEPDGQPINLHKFWDDLIIGSENLRSVRNRAIELRLRPDFARSAMLELRDPEFEHWIKRESFELARSAAYRDGQVTGSPDAATAPVLPADYVPQAKAIGERRIVLAGHRLADVLAQSIK